jgi:hypothetical protein
VSARLSLGELLAQSARFLDGDHSDAPAAPLCAALLAREALEQAIVAWAGRKHGLVLKGVSGRTKLTVLEAYLGDAPLSAQARFAWNTLSTATHHSWVGAARGPGEVRDLAVQVQDVIRGLVLDAQPTPP